MEDRVVVTGIGALTAAGNGKDALWMSVESGQTKATSVESGLGQEILACRIGEFQPEQYISSSLLRRMDRFTQLALVSVKLAIDDAALSINGEEERIGSILNTTHGPFNTTEGYLRTLIESGPNLVSPAQFSSTVTNVATGQISMIYQLKGASSTLTGSSSVTYATNLILDGKADVIIAVGVEEFIPTIARAYQKLGILGDGQEGLLLGEGSAALVLERYSHAVARGAYIYGEVMGYGIASDPTGNLHMAIQDPEGSALTEAMRQALRVTGIEPQQVSFVSRLANGVESNDRAESSAFRNVFGDHQPQTTSGKKVVGDTVGAAGTLGVALALLALDKRSAEFGMSLSSEIGGNNIAIVVGRIEEEAYVGA